MDDGSLLMGPLLSKFPIERAFGARRIVSLISLPIDVSDDAVLQTYYKKEF